MDIVIDTNIFRSDFLLRSKDFDILFDYLKKTDSSIIFPQIIYDELLGLYSRALIERSSKLKSALNNVNLAISDKTKELILPEINHGEAVSHYDDFIKKKLKLKKDSFIPYNNEHLQNIVKRAIARQKPMGEDGQGFRDALIWLSIKEYCVKCMEKQIVFISNNDKDFSDNNGASLHESLKEECVSSGIKINYFKSLREFIEQHSITIDFITEDWIIDNFDDSFIEDVVSNAINSSDPLKIIAWIQRENGNECSGYYKVLNVYPENFKNVFVYEMIDNKYIVNVTVVCEIEMEFEYYHPAPERWIGFVGHSYNDRPSSFGNTNLPLEVYVSLTVSDQKITDYEISDYGFY